MSRTILLVLPDSVATYVAGAMTSAAYDVTAAGSVRAALERVAASDGVRMAAIVADSDLIAADRALWTAALRGEPRLARVPVIVYDHGPDGHDRHAGFAHTTVPVIAGRPALAAAAMRAAESPPPPERIARGSERLDTSANPMDLHAYAEAKLMLYLGSSRAPAVLADITATLPGGRIVTTADLHEAARRLRARGDVEATVATLLSGRATLLDSDRTLRK